MSGEPIAAEAVDPGRAWRRRVGAPIAVPFAFAAVDGDDLERHARRGERLQPVVHVGERVDRVGDVRVQVDPIDVVRDFSSGDRLVRRGVCQPSQIGADFQPGPVRGARYARRSSQGFDIGQVSGERGRLRLPGRVPELKLGDEAIETRRRVVGVRLVPIQRIAIGVRRRHELRQRCRQRRVAKHGVQVVHRQRIDTLVDDEREQRVLFVPGLADHVVLVAQRRRSTETNVQAADNVGKRSRDPPSGGIQHGARWRDRHRYSRRCLTLARRSLWFQCRSGRW